LPGWCRAHSHLFLETDFFKHAQCRVKLAEKQGRRGGRKRAILTPAQ
jgi:hypothetical protein